MSEWSDLLPFVSFAKEGPSQRKGGVFLQQPTLCDGKFLSQALPTRERCLNLMGFGDAKLPPRCECEVIGLCMFAL